MLRGLLRISSLLLLTSSFCPLVFAQIKIETVIRTEVRGGVEIYYAEVTTDQPLKAGTTPVAALYDADGNQISRLVEVVSYKPGRFRIHFPAKMIPAGSYEIVLHEFQTDGDKILGGKSAAAGEFVIKLTTSNPACNAFRGRYFSVYVRAKNDDDYSISRLVKMHNWFTGNASKPSAIGTITVEERSEKGTQPRTVKNFDVLPRNAVAPPGSTELDVKKQGGVVICFAADEPPPSTDYDAQMQFASSAPYELREAILTTDIPGFSNIEHPSEPDLESTKNPLSLGKNLDVAVVLTSSVADEKQEDETTLRQRTTRGSLDLFFAPFLDIRSGYLPPQKQKWFGFWTPVYLDATVSTGKITEDTLSLNRIVIGTEKELRYYQTTDTFPTFYRVLMGGNHTSDRDFRQGEYKATLEFQPYFSRLVRPIESYWEVEGNILDKDPNRAPKLIPGVKGYTIYPLVGAELGRTYFRRNPAPALKPGDTVKRLYFGLDMNFQFSEKLNLSLKDLYYIRGESKTDRYHNYFKGSLEFFPEGSRRRNLSYGFFASFERGGLPPFSKPDVNAFKFGFRLLSRNWFDRYR